MHSTSLVLAAALALAAFVGSSAWAQSYPSKPVSVISAFPPGGANDFIVRQVDGSFQAAFKQPLVIEHRPGAGGNIGAEAVARAKSHHLSYASGGQGVPGHLAAEMFLAATGVRMTHVPYKGPAAAVQDLMGGNVHCGFLATPTAMPHVKSGKLIGLAVTAAKRSPMAMELPTMSEAGIAGFEASFGLLLMAPKSTAPAMVAARLRKEADKWALSRTGWGSGPTDRSP